MENDLFAQGTTGFMATSATNSDEIVLKAIDAAKEYRKKRRGITLVCTSKALT